MLDGIGRRQVSAQAVAQQNHFLQAYGSSPLLDGVDKMLLCFGSVRRERRSGAPAEAEEVEGVHGPRAAQRIQVPDP